MGLIHVIILLVIVGLFLYLLERYVPMDEGIKTIIRVLVFIVIAIWVLQLLGVWDGFGNHHIDDLRIN